MATVRKFEDLIVWQKSRELCRLVHSIIKRNESKRDISFFNQLSRSAGSVMDNIAEGFGRSSRKEFLQFLFIANGSLMETKSQLYRAFDQGYITEKESLSLLALTEEISAMIFKLSKYLQPTPIPGQKHI